jgi:hypothetical protein
LNSTKKALIAAAVAVIFSLGLIFWQVKARKGPVVLSPEDMTLIAEDQPAQGFCPGRSAAVGCS